MWCLQEEHPEEQLRWMDEAFYHNAISGHPNVVQCIQSWEEAGYFYIHMDYLPMRFVRERTVAVCGPDCFFYVDV